MGMDVYLYFYSNIITLSLFRFERKFEGLKETNLTPKRPATGPKLSPAHRLARVQFARDYLDWDRSTGVLFSDETRLCLCMVVTVDRESTRDRGAIRTMLFCGNSSIWGWILHDVRGDFH